jgi:hypothetical protein
MGELHDLGAERAARDTCPSEFPLSHWRPRADVAVPGENARNLHIVRTATQLRLMRANTTANADLPTWIRLLETELEAAKLSSFR